MSKDDFDADLVAFLAAPDAPPDRLFAARIDVMIGEADRLRKAESLYARGLLRDVAAVAAVVIAAFVLVVMPGGAVSDWLVALPAGLLLIILVAGGQPAVGSSPAP